MRVLAFGLAVLGFAAPVTGGAQRAADRRRSFGSLWCAPDQRSVAVLSQSSRADAGFFSTRRRLWQVSLDGSRQLLDTPPPGSADESPQWSRDGRSILLVREHNGYGQLMLRRTGHIVGPLASLVYNLGYCGHHDWGLHWSAASP